MYPFYWRGTTNFGDYMNHWLWPKLIPDLLSSEDNIRLIGIGSLLKAELNYVKGKKIIFGTGSGYGDLPQLASMEDWFFYFVRGPLTAKKFGLAPEKAIVDGAWLISQVSSFASIPNKKGVSFVPHWTTAQNGNWEKICHQAELSYIDPLGEFEKIIKSIAESELIIAESLHGAILADYYRTPWIPLQISPKFLNFKWYDWCESVELDFKVAKLPPSDFLECLSIGRNPYSLDYKLEFDRNPSCEKLAFKHDCSNCPPLFYKNKTLVKTFLKKGRDMCLEKLKDRRNMVFLSGWNERHCDNLSHLLKKLLLEEPFLSRDSVREEKIVKLQIELNKLMTDYKNGVFEL